MDRGEVEVHKLAKKERRQYQAILTPISSHLDQTNIIGTFSEIFGYLRQSSTIFGKCSGKCSETFVKPSEQLWEIFGKWSEIFGKSKTSLLVCLYNKQNITFPLVDFVYSRLWILSSRVQLDISLVRCAHSWDIELNTEIHIHAQACNILYLYVYLLFTLFHIATSWPSLLSRVGDWLAR